MINICGREEGKEEVGGEKGKQAKNEEMWGDRWAGRVEVRHSLRM